MHSAPCSRSAPAFECFPLRPWLRIASIGWMILHSLRSETRVSSKAGPAICSSSTIIHLRPSQPGGTRSARPGGDQVAVRDLGSKIRAGTTSTADHLGVHGLRTVASSLCGLRDASREGLRAKRYFRKRAERYFRTTKRFCCRRENNRKQRRAKVVLCIGPIMQTLQMLRRDSAG